MTNRLDATIKIAYKQLFWANITNILFMNELIESDRKRESYIELRIAGYGEKEAAKLAGFSIQAAGYLASAPEIRAAIHEGTLKLIESEAPKCIKVLCELRDDKKVSASVRESCAKAILNRAGIVEMKARELDTNHMKSLSEMSGDELRQEVARLSSEMANRIASAKVVEHVPDAKPKQRPDIFG